jgi:hypothetical protein
VLPLLRGIALVLGLGVIGTAVAWVVTRERKWLDRSLLLLKITVATGVVFFGVLLLERLR